MAGIDSYTKLLLHMDGDQSASGHEITFNGNPKFDNSVKKFGKSSLYLDGVDDRLTIPGSTDWNLGNGDFTIEFWFKIAASSAWDIFLHCGSNAFNATTNWHVSINDNEQIRCTIFATDTPTTAINTTNINDSEWHHYAAVRSGNSLRVAVDGSFGTSIDLTGVTIRYLSNSILTVGSIYGGNQLPNFYMDELRISKGIARWTENFTPPIEKYTTDSYTKLLLHCEGDQSASNHTVTSNGNPRLNAVTTKFDGAMYFDGSGDYLQIPDSEDWNFGGGDFTIDCWVNFSSLPSINSSYQIINQYSVSNNQRSFSFSIRNIDGTYYLRFVSTPTTDGTGITVYQQPYSFSIGVWYHVAVSKTGGYIYHFINGNQIGSRIPHAMTIVNAAQSLSIGGIGEGEGDFLIGYLDELRISKDIARWTENFTPPGTAYSWPMIGGTLAEDARILVINESDNSIVYKNTFSAGDYEIELEDTNYKTVIARKSDGEVVGFGKVTPQ